MKAILTLSQISSFFGFFMLFYLLTESIYTSGSILIVTYAIYFFFDYLLSKLSSCTIRARVYFLFGFLLLLFFTFTNYSVSVTKGTIKVPFLVGDVSGKFGYHNLALQISKAETWMEMLGIANITNHVGYPLILGLAYKFIYQDLLTAFFLCFLSGVLTIYLTSLLFSLYSSSKTGLATVVLFTAISPQILSCGSYILKDTYIINAVLFLFLSIEYLKRNEFIKFTLLFILSFVLIMLLRSQMIIIIAVLILSNYKALKEKMVYLSAGFVFMLFALLGSGLEFKYFDLSLSYFTNLIIDNGVGYEWSNVNTGITGILAKTTLGLPIFFRILSLPLTLIVQYFMPFNVWEINHIYPFYFTFINLNIIWWFLIGPFVIFSYIKLNSHASSFSKGTFITGVLMYSLMAFIYAGVVPRYAYPFMPILIISAASVKVALNENTSLKIQFKTFCKWYFISLLFAVGFYLSFSIIT